MIHHYGHILMQKEKRFKLIGFGRDEGKEFGSFTNFESAYLNLYVLNKCCYIERIKL